ncbi:MAG TPA: transposase [Terracidiphilus sp.]|nr:transposase [Terracidiphilus sp.]
MPRLARVLAVDTPYHVTQRGNARRAVFETDSDRLVYLSLLQEFARLYRLNILGYCLMRNHVHLIALPRRLDSMPRVLRCTHGRYAAYLNARKAASGHVWQGRYYSCPMDENHLWTALRYIERNPVRAQMADQAESYLWSSARVHCNEGSADGLVDLEMWRYRWSAEEWREFLACARGAEQEAEQIRQSTHNGRPLGSLDFIRQLEQGTGRLLTASKGGRPRRPLPDPGQARLAFAAESGDGR